MDPPSTIPPPLDCPPCRLCPDCEPLLLRPWEEPEVGHVEHKPNYRALHESAAQGCGLCVYFRDMVVQSLEKNGYDAEVTIQETLALQKQQEHCACIMFVSYAYSNEPYFRGWIDELEYIPAVPPFHEGRFIDDDHASSRFEVRISLLAGRNDYIGGRAVSEDVDLGRCQVWIDECHRNHNGCRKTGIEEQGLPTRILDVGSSDGSEEPKLTLSKDKRGRYVALSHRWGEPTPPTLTTVNLQKYLESIPIRMLPQMFQDAIFITRKLGYRFLWIDSLCILQDDMTDWQSECPRMVSTYRNAAVTIAGPGCENCFDGLLRPRKSHPVTRTLRLKSNDAAVDCVLRLEDSCIRKFENYSGHSSLSNRAWVLQERLLSPRVLYFGIRQMYFECNSSCACDGTVDTYQLEMPEGGAPKNILDLPQSELYENWQNLVGDYSQRFLTYGDDRLPGIAGLAGFIQHLLVDDYCAGLWSRDFINGLQWQRCTKGPCSVILGERRGPSWSWVSCNHGVTYHRIYDVHPDITLSDGSRSYPSPEHIKVIDMSLTMAGENPLGQVMSAPLRVSGRFKEIHLGQADCPMRYLAVYSADSQRSRIGSAIMDERELHDNSWEEIDAKRREANTTKAVCLLVSSGSCWYPKPYDTRLQGWLGVWVALILENATTEPHQENTFRRVGLVFGYRWCDTAHNTRPPEEVVNPAEYFDDAEESTATII